MSTALLYDGKKTKLCPCDVIYCVPPVIGITRDNHRVEIGKDDPSEAPDDKLFFGSVATPEVFEKIARSIARVAGFSIQPYRLSPKYPAYQFLQPDYSQIHADAIIRDNDVICYDVLSGSITILRNRRAIDVDIRHESEFFCFAKLLGLVLGLVLNPFHCIRNDNEVHLQFVRE